MIIKQLYTNCLAQASYYIESDGEVAIIDPIRDISDYVDLIGSKKLKYILETHFHADFVSGHLELAKKYSAPIIYGPNASPNYNFLLKKDGEILELGNIKFKIIHTPGHTLESISYLLLDEKGMEHAVFTGDTLFIGDVGIPDVAQRYEGTTKEELASILYKSLQKLKTLNNDVIVFPGHGKGTQCGKNLSSETYSTIGEQKKFNYALNFKNKSEFIKSICSNIPEPPNYFIETVNKNAEGYKLSHDLYDSLHALTQSELTEYINDDNYCIIDTRSTDNFARKHIKNSINISLTGSFAVSAGNLIDVNKKILLVCDIEYHKESFIRLLRVGFDNITGYLNTSIDSWIDDEYIDSIDQTTSEHLKIFKHHHIIDVRTKYEYKNSHLKKSVNLPLYELNKSIKILDRSEKYLVHCQTGYRSMIASSILKRDGFDITEIKDGFKGFLDKKSKKIVLPSPK